MRIVIYSKFIKKTLNLKSLLILEKATPNLEVKILKILIKSQLEVLISKILSFELEVRSKIKESPNDGMYMY
jgi:hypothetical protein